MNSHLQASAGAPTSRRRAKGVAWVAVGVSLLLGGSTVALWSASDSFTGGEISAGDLNIEKSEDTTFWDASPDRKDRFGNIPGTYKRLGVVSGVKAHEISDPDTWEFVPGDTVATSFEATVTLEGDNMVAGLTLAGLEDSTHEFPVERTFEVYSGGEKIISRSALPADADEVPLFFLSATGEGQDDGWEDADWLFFPPYTAAKAQGKVLAMDDVTRDFTVVVYNEAPAEIGDREYVNAEGIFGNLTLKLDQVRDKGKWF